MQVEKGFLDSGFFKQPNADNIIDANASASSLPYNLCFLSMTQIETGVVLGSLTLTEIKCAITYYGHWLIYAGSA